VGLIWRLEHTTLGLVGVEIGGLGSQKPGHRSGDPQRGERCDRRQSDHHLMPDTTYQLSFNSVQTSGDQVVYFVVSDGVESRQISADCSSGTLAGQEPADASEAQLLNAACQVAFGA
jgi:hypothetical protein